MGGGAGYALTDLDVGERVDVDENGLSRGWKLITIDVYCPWLVEIWLRMKQTSKNPADGVEERCTTQGLQQSRDIPSNDIMTSYQSV